MSNKGDDFSSATRQIIKRQAGGYCAKCGGKTTVYDGQGEKPSTTGEAAHIEASREGGPRYNYEDTVQYRRSVNNGIWLCNECHTLVDLEPNRFGADRLLQFKHDQWLTISQPTLLSTKSSDDKEKAFLVIDSYGAYNEDFIPSEERAYQALLFGEEWEFQSNKLNTLMNLIIEHHYNPAYLKELLAAMNQYSKVGKMDLVNKAVDIKSTGDIV